MNEKQAWESFCSTGSIEAYLHYVHLSREREAHIVTQEAVHADQHRRTHHSGAGCGRERSADYNSYTG